MKMKDVNVLEQAKTRDHKIHITDIAISKISRVDLSDFSEEQCIIMQEKHKTLLRTAQTQNGSNEVLFIDDLEFKSEVTVLGDEFKVSPGKNPFAASVIVNADRQSLIYMHNHPSTNIFSIGDIDTFVCEATIKIMSVVTNQGDVHILNKLLNYSYDNTRFLLNDIYNSFPDGEFDNRKFVNTFLKRCKEGGIEYAKSK